MADRELSAVPQIEEIIGIFLSDHLPWWAYGLAVLVPICMLITVREFSCWFWKVNKLVDRLERIELQLRNLRLGNEAPPVLQKPPAIEGSGTRGAIKAPVERPMRGPTEL